MDRILAPSALASASPVDLVARPRRRWSDGANYPWSLADEDDSAVTHWPTVVALLCERVARGCNEIERQVEGLPGEPPAPSSSSRDSSPSLPADAIRVSTHNLRETSMAMQMIVRLGSGSTRPNPEPVDLARLARRVSHERLREFINHRAEIGYDIRRADVVVDASAADRLINVALDWALSFSRRVRFKVGTQEGSRAVHLVVRATLPRPPERAANSGMPPRERRMNDNIHWILLRQLAIWAQLPVSRSSSAATESVVIQFPAGRPLPPVPHPGVR